MITILNKIKLLFNTNNIDKETIHADDLLNDLIEYNNRMLKELLK